MTVPAPDGAGRPLEFDFPAGLPAFENERRFQLVENPEFSPLVLLQSTRTRSLRFVCAPASLLDPAYQPEIGEEDAALLGRCCAATDTRPLLCLAILTFPEGGPPTANLMAPVLLDPETRRGVQCIQSSPRYSHCHPLRREPSCS
jgi:flagellar assembly factor FliW